LCDSTVWRGETKKDRERKKKEEKKREHMSKEIPSGLVEPLH